MKKMLMLAGLLFTACAALAGPRLRYTINEHWKFFKGECLGAEEPGYDVSRWETVDLPHTWNVADVEDEPYGWYRGRAGTCATCRSTRSSRVAGYSFRSGRPIRSPPCG